MKKAHAHIAQTMETIFVKSVSTTYLIRVLRYGQRKLKLKIWFPTEEIKNGRSEK